MRLSLEDREWKNFFIGDLFEIYTGTDLILSRMDNGDIPVISHSITNNGVAFFTSQIDNRKIFDCNKTISLADRGNFYAFVQKMNFYIGTRVKALEAKFKDSNLYILNFICPLINKQSTKFSYGNNATSKTGSIKILLPVTSLGNPDYLFMEQYMREKEERKIAHYENYILKRVNGLSKTEIESLSCKKWQEFKLAHLFTFSMGKSKGLNHLTQRGGEISYLSATNQNNGVSTFVEKEEKLMHKGNCIAFIRNGEGSMGYSVYKSEDFIATSDISIGYNDHLNYYIGMFITTMADTIRGKYNFGYKRSEKRLKNEIIQLPVDEEGNPDYDYMEKYMRQIEQKKLLQYLKYVENRD